MLHRVGPPEEQQPELLTAEPLIDPAPYGKFKKPPSMGHKYFPRS